MMDGGFSGGNLERPALQCLLADIRAGRIDIVLAGDGMDEKMRFPAREALIAAKQRQQRRRGAFAARRARHRRRQLPQRVVQAPRVRDAATGELIVRCSGASGSRAMTAIILSTAAASISPSSVAQLSGGRGAQRWRCCQKRLRLSAKCSRPASNFILPTARRRRRRPGFRGEPEHGRPPGISIQVSEMFGLRGRRRRRRDGA
jgi:hypothetical protein